MRENTILSNQIDWITIIVYLLLVMIGFQNIFSVNYDETSSLFDLSKPPTKQLIFIFLSVFCAIAIMLLDYLILTSSIVYLIYGISIALLVLVLLVGREVGGAKAWIDLPLGFKLQPAELCKISISLLLAKLYNDRAFTSKSYYYIRIAVVIIIPIILILLQPDPGTLIVFTAFLVVMYREGMTPFLLGFGVLFVIVFILTLIFYEHLLILKLLVLTAGISVLFIGVNKKSIVNIAIKLFITGFILMCIIGVDYIYNNILKRHHRDRIEVLLDPSIAPQGIGYNINQAKIAIGAGGIFGQGFLEGRQTNGKFVPEQNTDFIFCTIGEERGLLGSIFALGLLFFLIFRILWMAERQKNIFGRVYGYCVGCILFMHVTINIGMVLALFPVIGIPLPFISYGGSSLLTFTILISIMLKFDAHRMQMLTR